MDDVKLNSVKVQRLPRVDWKAGYFTMRGWVVILSIALAVVVLFSGGLIYYFSGAR